MDSTTQKIKANISFKLKLPTITTQSSMKQFSNMLISYLAQSTTSMFPMPIEILERTTSSLLSSEMGLLLFQLTIQEAPLEGYTLDSQQEMITEEVFSKQIWDLTLA